jgi:hypothetical protein
MKFYNGYTPQQRNKKLIALHRRWPNHSHPYYQPPCHLCGDPTAKVQPHSEDYAEDFRWEHPAMYAVCFHCHRRLHSRFDAPASWLAYKAHLRRGGYGSDLKTPKTAGELTRLAKALEAGLPFSLSSLPRQAKHSGFEWWELLTTDPRFLDQPFAKPR